MSQLFFDAVAFATKAHHNQRRKSSTDPYIAHPIRVAYLAIDAGLSEHAAAAAVLHDVVEDCDVDISDVFANFPYEVGDIVRKLTKWWGDEVPPEEKAANKITYYGTILSNQDAINIKILDRIDNLRDMLLLLPKQTKWVTKYLRKTKEEFKDIYPASNNAAIQVLFMNTVSLVERKLADQKNPPM